MLAYSLLHLTGYAKPTMDDLRNCFTRDALWEGRGRYREAFGRHEGRDAIVAMLGSYAVPQPHFAMNAHFLSSETITVSGDTAVGLWTMLQTSTYRDGRSDLRSAALQDRINALPGIFAQARTLRLNLMAEGIESTEQLNVLRKAGCAEGQGYVFSRPLSVDEFAKILKVGHSG